MLKIRLMRIGGRQRPFYRVVAVDERAKRTGGYIELLGTYNPLSEPKEIKLKQDRIDHWVKQGAQLSDGFLRIIGKAKQRLPRKPKKEKKTEGKPAGEPAPVAEEPSKAPAIEAAPVEETRPPTKDENQAQITTESPKEDAGESETKDEGSA